MLDSIQYESVMINERERERRRKSGAGGGKGIKRISNKLSISSYTGSSCMCV